MGLYDLHLGSPWDGDGKSMVQRERLGCFYQYQYLWPHGVSYRAYPLQALLLTLSRQENDATWSNVAHDIAWMSMCLIFGDSGEREDIANHI